jgi:CBS domain-containing protein
MKILEIMSKAVIIDDTINLRQAAKIMSDKNIGSLIIVKSNKIKGILTERDIMKNINKLSSKVSAVMSKNVITISSNDEIENASELMGKNKIKRLPVMDDNKLAGIISITDLIAHSRNLNQDFLFD